ncbi:hypothetical protein ElyMa_002114500 [Elysia marginata]|uniref:Uncharacterized protein n=1 Tax=Elysia marginata TaxID=1093978 RepID=A0AAV4FHQ8_9GAST|nr:hypothetical protein ElyMa_002114500 [Elysia marginata]
MGNAYKQRRRQKGTPYRDICKEQTDNTVHLCGDELGLSEFYDSKTIPCNNIESHYSNEGVMCPPQLRTREFVVGAADNIDHNPSSTTSTGPFHGTGVSLFQNCAVTTKPEGTTPVGNVTD